MSKHPSHASSRPAPSTNTPNAGTRGWVTSACRSHCGGRDATEFDAEGLLTSFIWIDNWEYLYRHVVRTDWYQPLSSYTIPLVLLNLEFPRRNGYVCFHENYLKYIYIFRLPSVNLNKFSSMRTEVNLKEIPKFLFSLQQSAPFLRAAFLALVLLFPLSAWIPEFPLCLRVLLLKFSK